MVCARKPQVGADPFSTQCDIRGPKYHVTFDKLVAVSTWPMLTKASYTKSKQKQLDFSVKSECIRSQLTTQQCLY